MAAKAHGKGRQKRPNNTTDSRKKRRKDTRDFLINAYKQQLSLGGVDAAAAVMHNIGKKRNVGRKIDFFFESGPKNRFVLFWASHIPDVNVENQRKCSSNVVGTNIDKGSRGATAGTDKRQQENVKKNMKIVF